MCVALPICHSLGFIVCKKVRIQFPFAPRKGNDMTEKLMKHIHIGTRARAHILMQRHTLNANDE